MVNKIFVDANVILDFILKRKQFESAKILFELAERNRIRLFISSSVLHIIAHWLTKYLGSDISKTTMLATPFMHGECLKPAHWEQRTNRKQNMPR